jgi:hypothetical protein
MRMISDTDEGVALLQVGSGVAAVALTYVLARRVATPAVAALAAWWIALSPIHVVDSSVILTEVPFSVFLLVAILLVAPVVEGDAVSLWRWAGSGLVLGLATLIRPIALYLPMAVVLVLLLSRVRGRRFLAALLFVVAFAIPVGSWMARNHAVTGVATISTIQGLNLAYYRAAGAIAAEERISIDEARERIEAQVQAESFPGVNLGELSQIQSRVGMREIAHHPVGYARSAVRGLAYMLLGPAQSHFVERFKETPVGFLTKPLIALSAASALLLTLGSVIGVFVWARARAWRPLLLVGVPLGYLLIVGAGHEAWARFRVPIEPLLAILAAVGILGVKSLSPAGRGPRTRSR